MGSNWSESEGEIYLFIKTSKYPNKAPFKTLGKGKDKTIEKED